MAPSLPPSAWLTPFNAPRSVLYADFGSTGACCLLLRYYWRLGSSDAVENRAEGVEVRQFTDGTARTPTACRTTFNATRSVLYATFGTTEA
jgi:hypothetical protein